MLRCRRAQSRDGLLYCCIPCKSGRRMERKPRTPHGSLRAGWEDRDAWLVRACRCGGARILRGARARTSNLSLHQPPPPRYRQSSGHASLPRPPAISGVCAEDLALGPAHWRPEVRPWSRRVRPATVGSWPIPASIRRQSQVPPPADGPVCAATEEALHAARCSRSGRDDAARPAHIRLPQHQVEPDHLLAGGAVGCKTPDPLYWPGD